MMPIADRKWWKKNDYSDFNFNDIYKVPRTVMQFAGSLYFFVELPMTSIVSILHI